MVLRGAAWCCVVLRGAAWCCVVLRGAAWCCVMLRGACAGHTWPTVKGEEEIVGFDPACVVVADHTSSLLLIIITHPTLFGEAI